MKAVLLQEPGRPEVLHLENIPDPKPNPSEILIRVKACSINHLDIWLREGLASYGTQFPHILGCDISGIVEEIPPGSPSNVKKGDRVIVVPGISCFACAMCQSGRDNLCEKFTIIGAGRPGGYAELVCVPARNVIPIGDDLDFVNAAAFPLTFLTAWHMLVTRGNVQAGQRVLVLGGGSGVGTAAIQIAKYHGAFVITTVGGEEKVAPARDLGADVVINHTKTDWEAEVKTITGKAGVDIVFEHVGVATWEKSVRVVKKGGMLVTCGATSGRGVPLDLRYFYSRELNIHGSLMGTRAEFDEIIRCVNAGQLHPVVDEVFPLSEVVTAHKRMESRKIFGKLVLVP